MSIYCFDLDGTLGWTDGRGYEATRPYLERIAAVNRLFDEGHTIIIDSARGSLTGEEWQYKTKRLLDEWGLKFHELRTGKKVYADWYVDDKAVRAEDFFGAPTH